VDETWTINELVAEVERRIVALPRPQNGQIRAVPDDRTVRYYATIGLIDRPSAMRGRTALYGKKHVAQVVAIKRLQAMGRSLAEIQALWPTLDDVTLSRMSGIELPGGATTRSSRKDFWKAEPAPIVASPPARPTPSAPPMASPRGRVESAELRVELAPNVSLSIALSGHKETDIAISMADVAAIRAAAAPLIAELARRQLAVHAEEDSE
jgi:DNA-binding transcriptional MerR regulator